MADARTVAGEAGRYPVSGGQWVMM